MEKKQDRKKFLFNRIRDKIADYKIEKIDTESKTQTKRIEKMQMQIENIENKIKLKNVEEYEKTTNDKYKQHIIVKGLLTITSVILSVIGVVSVVKSPMYLFAVGLIFTCGVGANNFILSNTTIKLVKEKRQLDNILLLFLSIGITTISIASNYICTQHFSNVFYINLFSAVLPDIIPIALSYIYITNQIENAKEQKERIKNIETGKNVPSVEEKQARTIENEKQVKTFHTVENRAIGTILKTGKNVPSVEEKQARTIEKQAIEKPSVKRTSASKITFEDFQANINNLENGTVVKPKLVEMTGNGNYKTWIKKVDNVYKNDDGNWIKQDNNNNIIQLTKRN